MLSQTQLLQRLTHGCRYDRLERPIGLLFLDIIPILLKFSFNFFFFIAYNEHGIRLPVNVHARAYIYFMQNLEAHDLVSK